MAVRCEADILMPQDALAGISDAVAALEERAGELDIISRRRASRGTQSVCGTPLIGRATSARQFMRVTVMV